MRYPLPIQLSALSDSVAKFPLALVLFAVVGCASDQYLDDTYGRHDQMSGAAVNGTRVLGQMFEQAGHRVSRWYAMSPSLAEADVIVWVPDDYEPPKREAQEWLENWLVEQPDRVLIYVGRDFDAAPLYWSKARPLAPPALKAEFAKRQLIAEGDEAAERPTSLSNSSWPGVMKLDNSATPNKVKSLAGPWSKGIDASKIEIERETRLLPVGEHEVLLATGSGDPLVSTVYFSSGWGSETSQIVLIENGSWMLNLPLVNHEHRKLAGKLVDSVGPPSRRVVFLESNADGPPITEEDPNLQPPTGLGLLGVWPIGILLAQLAVLGMVYAFAQWPILVTPSNGEQSSLTDFRRHIRALGRLLRETGDRAFAIATVSRYRQIVRGETSAAVVAEPAVPAPENPEVLTLE